MTIAELMNQEHFSEEWGLTDPCDLCDAGAGEPCYFNCPGNEEYWAEQRAKTERIAVELASIKQGLTDCIERCNRHLRTDDRRS